MVAYITSQDVTDEVGEIAKIWPNLTLRRQQSYLDKANGLVDSVTDQNGGLLTQTAKVHDVDIETNTNRLWLPNRPITAISALTVKPRVGSLISYTSVLSPLTITIKNSSFTFDPSGGDNLSPTFRSADYDYPPFPEDGVATVTYDCGVTVVPEVVKEAALEFLEILILQRLRNPMHAQDLSLSGAGRLRFDRTQTALQTRFEEVARLLAPYTVYI